MKKKGRFRLMKQNELMAVHDDDLARLLKSLKKYDDVLNGRCECVFCKSKIDLSNIGSIIPKNDTIQFSCNEDRCINLLIDSGGENDS